MVTFENYLAEVAKKILDAAIEKFVKQGNNKEEVVAIVNSFDALSKSNKIKGVNIQTVTFPALKDIVTKTEATQTKTQQKKMAKIEGADVVLDNDKAMLLLIKNTKASCMYGSGTKWCISAKESNQFDNYSKKANIYMVLPKNNDGKIAFLVDHNGQVSSAWDDADSQKDVAWLKNRLSKYDIEI